MNAADGKSPAPRMTSWGDAIRAGLQAALDKVNGRPSTVRLRTARDSQGEAQIVGVLSAGKRGGARVCIQARAFGSRTPRGQYDAPEWAYVEVYVIGRAGTGVGDPALLAEASVPPTFVMRPDRWERAASEALYRSGLILNTAARACLPVEVRVMDGIRKDTTRGANDDDQPIGGER